MHLVQHKKHNSLSSKVDGLLGRSALTVDTSPRHSFRQLGRKDDISPNIASLCANLGYTSNNHIIHQCPINSSPVDEGVNNYSSKGNRVPISQTPTLSTTSSSNGFHNVCAWHEKSLFTVDPLAWFVIFASHEFTSKQAGMLDAKSPH
jgi:hypothetical protein